jgi:hypothetical protein
MRYAPMNLRIVGLAVSIAALATLAHAQPAGADSNQLSGATDTTIESGADANLWRSNTRKAFESQGSLCPWSYVGAYFDPTTPAAAARDAIDPVTNRPVRLFVDCLTGPQGVLEPTPSEMAAFAWERARTAIPTPSVRLLLADNTVALVGTDTPYWLDISEQLTVTSSLGGTSATITFKPTSITTNWGDGKTTTCSTPTAASPAQACKYRFAQPSSSQPSKAFTVTHEVTWSATWSTRSGAGGSFEPVTRASESQVSVIPYESNRTVITLRS